MVRHESSISDLKQKMQWLMDRVSTLADNVDSVGFEISKAKETATQAEAIATKALAIARRNPSPDNNPRVSNENPEFPQPDVPPNGE